MCSPRLCPVISDIGLSLITCLCHWIPNISYLSYLGLHPSLKVGNTPHNKEKNVSHSFTRNIASMWLVNNSFQPEAHRISEGFFDSRDPFRSPSVTGLPSTKLQFEMPTTSARGPRNGEFFSHANSICCWLHRFSQLESNRESIYIIFIFI